MREIFEVIAKVVDANGSYNDLTGFPKVFDSRQYNDDAVIASNRAYGAYHDALGAMCKVDSRQVQYACILRCSDGMQIARSSLGGFADGNTD